MKVKWDYHSCACLVRCIHYRGIIQEPVIHTVILRRVNRLLTTCTCDIKIQPKSRDRAQFQRCQSPSHNLWLLMLSTFPLHHQIHLRPQTLYVRNHIVRMLNLPMVCEPQTSLTLHTSSGQPRIKRLTMSCLLLMNIKHKFFIISLMEVGGLHIMFDHKWLVFKSWQQP